jgi:predicted LPLAT superfamily acyltransferase
LLFCSHLGNVELASILAERLDNIRFNILVHTRHAEKINNIFNAISHRNNCKLFQVSQFDMAMAIHLNEKLERGEWIIITCDRTPVSGSTHVAHIPFLGRMAPFSEGPFILAILLGCPVYTLFCCKNDHGLYEMHVDKFADTIKCAKKDRAITILEAQKRYVALLEKMVIRYPLQWFNFFNFWTVENDK